MSDRLIVPRGAADSNEGPKEPPFGGPAFPQHPGQFIQTPSPAGPVIQHVGGYPGMSLRDWFAGQALIGQMSHPHSAMGMLWEDVLDRCYKAADAAIVVRAR